MVNFKIYEATTCLTNNYKHILPNISQIKKSVTMNFGHLTEKNQRNIFFKINAENEAERLIHNIFFFK